MIRNDSKVNVEVSNVVSRGNISACVGRVGPHGCEDYALVLKPCKLMSYDDKSSVYYYLQCEPPAQSGFPVGLVNNMCISSFAGHHVDKTMTPGAVISVDNLDINTSNPLSQCDHQVKESTAVEDVAWLEAEVPDTHCSGSICGMSVMNWKKIR